MLARFTGSRTMIASSFMLHRSRRMPFNGAPWPLSVYVWVLEIVS